MDPVVAFKLKNYFDGPRATEEIVMEKIINGIVYDPETAYRIGCYSYMDDKGATVDATLYVNIKNGRYFLYGPGAYATTDLESEGIMQGRGDLYLLSTRKALRWAEKHLTKEEVKNGMGGLQYIYPE
jgi:hypothetical protein